MIQEGIKYRAETLRIFGLIFFTPIGRLFYDVLYTGKDYGIIKLVVLVMLSSLLAYVGLILIDRGRKLLDYSDSIILKRKGMNL